MEKKLPIPEARKIIEEELAFTCPEDQIDWFDMLSSRVNDLIQHDFSRLIFLLYKLDIDESGLKQLLNTQVALNAGDIIAELIIERQMQKIRTREMFKTSPEDIDENEKW